MRRWTLTEYATLVIAAGELRRTEPELGELVERLARGEWAVLPEIFDRLNQAGRFEEGERIRRVACGE